MTIDKSTTGGKLLLCTTAVVLACFLAFVQPMNAGPQGPAQGFGAAEKPLGYAIAFDADLFTVFLGVLEFGSGAFKPTSILEVPLAGLGRHQGNIYGLDIYGYFWQVNQGSGRLTPIGDSGITGPTPGGPGFVIDIFGGMADGRLFALDFANNLYRIDPETGAATLIGSTGIPELGGGWGSGLAGDCESLYFSLFEFNSDMTGFVQPPTLYRINPETAAAQYIGPTAEGIVGAAFVDGTLFGFGADFTGMGGPPARVLAIDTTSGAATLVSTPEVVLWGAINHDGARIGHCK